MLAISTLPSNKTLTPNILPCTLKHNGPVTTASRYWNPSIETDESRTAYFRGRKLRGKAVAVPEGYQGLLLEKTEKQIIAKPAIPVAGEDGEEFVVKKHIETKIMDQKAGFEEAVVWGHDAVPGEEDEFIKGMQEWVGFAEAMHSYDTKDSDVKS